MNAAPKIPIQNIYYLLCYAWNKLEERNVVDVSGIESTSVLDLFAKVLIGGLRHLFKRGIDRGYVTYAEDTKCLRGKICFAPTIKRNLLMKAQVFCEYDELNHNVLHNQIIKASLGSLIRVEGLNIELKDELIGLYRKLQEIDDIQLSSAIFSRVQLHRNNGFYDFLLKICELIYDNLLITEDPGKSKFRDFLQDETKMAYLFEEFVRNFYKIELASKYHGYKVKGSEYIFWDVKEADGDGENFLPVMKTDISIRTPSAYIIIDTKYSKETLQSYHKKTVKSKDLYQLFAYLKNIEKRGGEFINCEGILLYPTVDQDLDLKYEIQGHKISVRTIDLSKDWRKIHNDLMLIVGEETSSQQIVAA